MSIKNSREIIDEFAHTFLLLLRLPELQRKKKNNDSARFIKRAKAINHIFQKKTLKALIASRKTQNMSSALILKIPGLFGFLSKH